MSKIITDDMVKDIIFNRNGEVFKIDLIGYVSCNENISKHLRRVVCGYNSHYEVTINNDSVIETSSIWGAVEEYNKY